MRRSTKAFGKHPRSAARTHLAIAGAGCAVAGALSLRGIIDDPPKANDPPLWIFVGLAIGSVAFALLAIAGRAHSWWALLALIGSVLSLVAFWTLVVLFAG